MDGALTVPPGVRAVPPVRNTSASSMQSPPASADGIRVIILSPVFARPGALPQVEALLDELTPAPVAKWARRHRRSFHHSRSRL